jgi:nicotinamidase-related amidase
MSDEFTAPEFGSAALLTIDVQLDFLDDGPAAIPGTTAILPALGELVAHCRARDRPIVHAVRLYAADGSNVDRCRRALISAGSQIVRPGSTGSGLPDTICAGSGPLDHERLGTGEFVPLGPREHVMYKPRWSAFYATDLHAHLSALGISTLIVAGCNYPNCPRATIYDASARDYRLVIVEDATSRFDERARSEMSAIGVSCLTLSAVREKLTAEDVGSSGDNLAGSRAR